jgi:hypothetical protein
MLGLGCKSALAYADQFTLVGVKDGTRTAVSVSRDERGAGTMTILEQGPTEDPNGVTVSIPVRRRNSFQDKAERLFAFWPEGSVQVNGQEPRRIDGYRLTDDLLVVNQRDYGLTEHTVVMGNVPYPAPDLRVKVPHGKVVVARIPIGSVQFAPSRESLQETRTTKAGLEAVATAFRTAATQMIERDVAQAKTAAEAVERMNKAEDALGLHAQDVKWQGQAIPRDIHANPDDQPQGYRSGAKFIHVTGRHSWQPENQHSKVVRVPMSLASRAVWITGWDNADWTAANRRKLLRYCEVEQIDGGQPGEFLLTRADKQPGGQWLAHRPCFAWDTVRKWKDPDASKANVPTGNRGYAGTYPGWGEDGIHQWKLAAASIDTKRRIFYTHGHGNSTTWNTLKAAFGPCYLLKVTGPREAKFKRLFPEAKTASEGLTEAANTWTDTLTDDQRKAIATFRRNRDYAADKLRSLGRVDDPELAEWKRLAPIYEKVSEDWEKHGHAQGVKLPQVRPADLSNYPLLPRYNISRGQEAEHCTLYVNAAYAARTKESK